MCQLLGHPRNVALSQLQRILVYHYRLFSSILFTFHSSFVSNCSPSWIFPQFTLYPPHLKKCNNSLASLLDMHRCNELRPLPIKSPTKHLPRLQLHAIVQSLTKLADAELLFHIYHVSAGQEYHLFHLNISTICSSLFDNYIMEESREKCFEFKVTFLTAAIRSTII